MRDQLDAVPDLRDGGVSIRLLAQGRWPAHLLNGALIYWQLLGLRSKDVHDLTRLLVLDPAVILAVVGPDAIALGAEKGKVGLEDRRHLGPAENEGRLDDVRASDERDRRRRHEEIEKRGRR
jgi:hypothetical protein